MYGNFRVTLSDGEEIWASLGFETINEAEVGGLTIRGSGLRIIRVNAGAGSISGVNLTEVAGVVTLSKPGTLQLRKKDSAVQITTSAGVTLAEEWLGGSVSQVEARTLAGEWVAVGNGNSIADSVVQEWARATERTLVDFRVTV
jgi:hypothetical protein